MEAIAKMKDPVLDAFIWGHHYVCGILVYRDHVIPFGIRLYVKPEHCKALGRPFRKPTEVAAHRIRECQAPRGVQVMVLLDAYYLCPTVVQACREQQFHFASTLKSHRSLCKLGWKRKAGRFGRNLFRRRRTETLEITKPSGLVRSRCLDAGWLKVSKLGPLHVVFSRKGMARKILGLVTDAPELSAAGLIRMDDKRWSLEPIIKDAKQLLGLGQDQNRSYGTAVLHLHLVCFADALLTHWRIMRDSAQGHRKRDQAADRSTAAAQDQLRSLIWDDLLAALREQPHGETVLSELERLRVA
jgi:SRSO17 transposase